ncbi:ATP-binding protein [Oceanisphaera sp. W20_SRM_FM3]|uniref:ATP-binding protein n=1 Tax=Oceanisphaera sp. W20_SRM_FM3 TaxID=3240267 RepID=UPI003F9EA9E6
MSNRFLHAQTVIEALRDNGYNNTAYALGELIDNSLQAGATRVELGFIEEQSTTAKRKNFNVTGISVWDNGKGMSPETLRTAMQFGGGEHRNDPDGMGRFGMGLPNSSISQCRRVDVWSWQNGASPYFTFLDVNMMADGQLEEVPEPVQKDIPEKYKKAFFPTFPDSGTLVIWTQLDRLNWKTGKSIFTHCENLVGRMYRNFIHDGKIKIEGLTYRLSSPDFFNVYDRAEFKANDPMYLLKNTSLPTLPGNYAGESFFEFLNEQVIEIDYVNDLNVKVKGNVVIVTSVVKQAISNEILKNQNQSLGHTIWGKHCAKNTGVSIVRAGRELVLRDSFLTSALRESKGRFIGIEVSFPPSLDSLFGVLNNKQDAINLVPHDKARIAEDLGFELLADYDEELLNNEDNFIHVLKVTDAILENVKIAEKAVGNVNVKAKPNVSTTSIDVDSPAGKATLGSGYREDHGNKTADFDKPLDINSVKETLKKGLGFGEQEAQEKAENIVLKGYRYHIDYIAMDSDAFFDVSSKNGLTLVLFNTEHAFYSDVMERLKESERMVMETVMAGFARVMNEESQREKHFNYLNLVRRSWGKVVSEFLEGPSLEDDVELF